MILSDVDREKAGVASGTNTTVRQVGAALGIAVIGSLLNAQAIRHAVRAVRRDRRPSPRRSRRRRSLAIRAKGVNYAPPSRATTDARSAALTHALQSSVVDGARPALLFAAAVVTLGAFLSLLIPTYGPPVGRRGRAEPGVEPGEIAVAVEML